jgi:2',3'-cyclic-nucleotide 2'-phosphodiesterase/3'-nucleotidase
VTALQPVNEAQRDYVERYVARNSPDLAGIPVLSAAAAFKGGFGGPGDYTDIAPGPLAIHNAADLYLYPNTLTAVKIDGATLKGWLERSAERFNRIDPEKREPQELVNRKFPSYNFDVIQGGVTYAIDVTKPEGARIVDLRYRGKSVDAKQAFIVVTNNYRASGGGRFPRLDGSNIAISAPDANRDVLIAWVREHRQLTRKADGSDRNWRFAPVRTKGPVTFTTATGKTGLAKGLGVRWVKDNGDGFATYEIDFAAKQHAKRTR